MDETAIKRVMPHSLEAEQSIIGSMLLDREAITVTSEILLSDDFYQKQLGSIFGAMIQLYESNSPVDLVTLKNKLTEIGIIEQIGGIEYLTQLATSVPTSTHIKYYVKIVKEKS